MLFRLTESARENGLNPADFRIEKIISFGKDGFSIATIREHVEKIWDAECFDRYGMTEAGSIAGECEAHPGGMHLLESEFIAEVIDPETCKPMKEGELGELVLTNLGRSSRPIVRYRTGDLVRLVRDHQCSCGRQDARLLGGVTRGESKVCAS
jgi:phenylacetate-CoA ligase